MAKGQKRSTREPRKPKQPKAKPAAGHTVSVGSLGHGPGVSPAASKTPRAHP